MSLVCDRQCGVALCVKLCQQGACRSGRVTVELAGVARAGVPADSRGVCLWVFAGVACGCWSGKSRVPADSRGVCLWVFAGVACGCWSGKSRVPADSRGVCL